MEGPNVAWPRVVSKLWADSQCSTNSPPFFEPNRRTPFGHLAVRLGPFCSL